MRHRITLLGEDERLWLARDTHGYRLDLEEGSCRVALEELGGARRRLSIDGLGETVFVALDGDDIYLHVDGVAHHLRHHDAVTALGEDAAGGADEVARAPMPGIVVAVHVAPGQAVAAGDALLVIESMKLETTIRARSEGAVAAVHVAEGDSFERDAVLVSFERGNA